jgi:hypothetical protein
MLLLFCVLYVQMDLDDHPANQPWPPSSLSTNQNPLPGSRTNQNPAPPSDDVLPGSPAAEESGNNRKRRGIFSRVFSKTYLPDKSIIHKRY